MSKPVFNNSFIGSYIDNSREYNIDARGKDLSTVLRAIEAEDVTPSEDFSFASDNLSDSPSSPASDNRPKKTLPFFIPEKLAELGTYSEDEFESMYHDAVKGGAPKLAKFLKHYRELEIFDTKGYNKKETFEELKTYFGDELDFGYPNFAVYY